MSLTINFLVLASLVAWAADRRFDRTLKLDPNHVAALKDMGSILYNAQSFTKAAEIYERVIAISPDTEALMGLGTSVQRLGHLERAMELYKAILELHPAHPHAKLNIGVILHEAGNTAEAIEIYKECLNEPNQTDERRAHVLNNMGAAQIVAQRLDEGVATLTEALTLNPKNPNALVNLGAYYNEEGNLDLGNDMFIKAFSLIEGEPRRRVLGTTTGADTF